MNDEVILQALERSVIAMIQKGDFIRNDYSERLNVSPQVKEIYSSLDWNHIRELVTAKMEEVVAEKIVNNYITEFGNDIKSSLSNAIIRDELKSSMDLMINRMLKTIRENEDLD
jgi:hypothetical protein